ncbi:MAG: hypothetical protein Q9198_005470 [Flavoplaca austrocitrina]
MKAKLGHIGDLDSLHFEEDRSLQEPLDKDQVEISILATGMNFKDVMISFGQIPFYHELGLECSGQIEAIGSNITDYCVGDRVCALAKGAYASKVRVHHTSVAKIPEAMTDQEAASIPVIFCTAYYALFEAGRLSKGESILIHAAAGGVGQAAIMLAQHAEAEIFVTVSSVEKMNFLIENYGLPRHRVFSSRDISFAKNLKDITCGRGVDVVLNSTAGEILQHSWRCLAPLGRFVEIGKRDIVQNSNLEMEKFADSVSFISVDLGVLLEVRPLLVKQLLLDVMDLFKNQAVKPVSPIMTLPMSQISRGMRMMQGGKHMGKIVIEVTNDDIATPVSSPNAISDREASYLVTGGTGGLGRSITRWLARQGARYIILASRSGAKQKGMSKLLDDLKESDCKVVIKQCDVASSREVRRMIEECNRDLPPIRGVIHGAMALRDALFDRISFADWTLNIAPRVNGAWNLHNSLSGLNFFVILASGSGLVGNPGQTAYAASNTFLDAFAAYRQELGLPACTIDIGIVEGVGYVAENIDRRAEIESAAHDRLSEEEVLALIKIGIVNCKSPNYRQIQTGCKLFPDKPLPLWAHDPKFSHIVHGIKSNVASRSEDANGSFPVKSLLQATQSIPDATELIVTALNKKLSSILLLPPEEMESKKPIVAYGLDSLVAMEYRNWITRDLEANVSLMELMNSPSIEHLARKVAEKSKLLDRVRLAGGTSGEKELNNGEKVS